ncbi:polysaccharide pyruvyl transferase family protein [Cryobacterium soli]|uniref:polysaccharide pyruvyl transferase family protein n=1 Tax=Cryobacterium soli TaxID=2220095 RepID=UPI001FEB25A4|nr:polysaccharide pyruvyl transferase family protein [Cryobacterium soli]
MLKEIANSRFVLSSSLHGVVVAHSLGVPAQLLTNEAQKREPMWKYEDYFASLGASMSTMPFERLLDASTVDEAYLKREEEAPSLESASSNLAKGLASSLREHF